MAEKDLQTCYLRNVEQVEQGQSWRLTYSPSTVSWIKPEGKVGIEVRDFASIGWIVLHLFFYLIKICPLGFCWLMNHLSVKQGSERINRDSISRMGTKFFNMPKSVNGSVDKANMDRLENNNIKFLDQRKNHFAHNSQT